MNCKMCFIEEENVFIYVYPVPSKRSKQRVTENKVGERETNDSEVDYIFSIKLHFLGILQRADRFNIPPPPLRITSVGTRVADTSMLLTSYLLCCGGVGIGTVSSHSDFNVELFLLKNLSTGTLTDKGFKKHREEWSQDHQELPEQN